jgi:hypothetical protein
MSRSRATWGARASQIGPALAPTQGRWGGPGEERRSHATWGTAASDTRTVVALGAGRWGGPGEERRSLPPVT